MRKTLNINLGGMAFIIDENAFELLHNYLEALKRKFNNAAEREEIMNDIEGRIAEMLNQKLAGRKEVLSAEDVQAVMDIMGKPEDIAGEESAPSTESTTTTSATNSTTGPAAPVHRKLFRDTDDAKVGGVISGLCHYFGINDPVWARIGALVLIPLTSGGIILLYLLLIIVVPKAITAAEKLQMKGEPVNISTIEKEIKDAAGRATDSVHKFVREQNFFEKFWDVFVSVFMVLWKVAAGFVIFIGLIILLVLLGGLFGFSIAGNALLTQAPHLLVDGSTSLRLFNLGVFLLIGVPVVALIYGALRLIFGNKGNGAPWLKWLLISLWFVGAALVAVTSYRTVTDFVNSGVKKTDYTLMQPTGSLYVQLTDSSGNKIPDENEDDRGFNIQFNGAYVNGVDISEVQLIDIGKPSLQLIPSTTGLFVLEESVSSQGRTKADAVKNAETVIYNFSQKDSVLNLPYNAYLNKNNKWRSQSVTIRLAIPEGKTVRFGSNIDNWPATVKGNGKYDDTEFANTVWTVENGKVKCIAGENHKHEDKVKDKDKSNSKGDKDEDEDSDKKDSDKDKDF
ncbi:MAG: hypothetical protein JWO06_2531 [Bacteroidota bacterium]|nr:hypothetical protein [Bacteroidota bacterium]